MNNIPLKSKPVRRAAMRQVPRNMTALEAKIRGRRQAYGAHAWPVLNA